MIKNSMGFLKQQKIPMSNFKISIVLLLIALFSAGQSHRFSRLLYLPIDPMLVEKANFQTSLFLMTLNLYNHEVKHIHLQHLQIIGTEIQYTFQQLDKFLESINNLVMGYNNRISGSKHRILVDNVVVRGNGGWILKKNFQGHAEGDLIMGDYKIDLDGLNDIQNRFREVVIPLYPKVAHRRHLK